MDTSSSAVAFKAENALKILTPWWDVVLKYITSAIVTIALATLPIQAAKDTLACVVTVKCPNSTTESVQICEINDQTALSTYTNLACFTSLGISAQFFYVILVGEAVALLFANNIWSVLYPKTALTLSHFISIVSECYDSIGTPEQISRLLDPTREEAATERLGIPADEGRSTREMGPLAQSGSSIASVERDPELDNESKSRIKTIYHKVTKFSDAQIQKKSLFFLYLFQQFLQLLFAGMIITFNILVFGNGFDQDFECSLPNNEFLPMKYDYIVCHRYIASLYTAISWVFISFVILYFLVAVAVCVFMRMSKNIPSFTESNDLDFLCFLLNQYSTFQYERFALFDMFDRNTKNRRAKVRGSFKSSYNSFPEVRGFQKFS